MGLFDRFRSAGRARAGAGAGNSNARVPEQDAVRLIDEGNAIEQDGRIEAAMQRYEAAVRLAPNLARAHLNRGNVLLETGDVDGALEAYATALAKDPDYAGAHYNMGNACVRASRREAALAAYRKAIALKPDFADAEAALGAVLEDLGQLGAAAASYRRALAIKPDYAEVHSNLLFLHNYLADQSPMAMLAEARRFGELAARRARPYRAWPNVPESARCLRVGLVSGDLRNHPVGYFAEGALAAMASLAHDRLELFAYPTHASTDAVTERIKACCRGWRPAAGLPDERLAHLIREDRVDILIDLSGHTLHNRLPMFAWKPAPVQVTWLGYFATTGVAEMDYLIADPWTLPQSEEGSFTERIWRLPETRLCFTPPDEHVEVTALPALRNGYITFGCFNHLTKVNDRVVTRWAELLAALPDSRLFLKSAPIAETSLRQDIVDRFAARGIGANRLILEGAAPRAAYLAAYQRVDIALDPFPYPGGATTVEALWMGVPVLTLAGKSFVSRQGVGLMMNAGLPEWVAIDGDDYVGRAVSLGSDLRRLASLRERLRGQVLSSPIFDAPRFAGHLEAALRGMWQAWCRQRQDRP